LRGLAAASLLVYAMGIIAASQAETSTRNTVIHQLQDAAIKIW